MKVLRVLAIVPIVALLGGCNMVVLHPAGDIAMRERNLIVASTALMLLIIIPVVVTTLIFAWRYRAANTAAIYDPDWHHSTQLELLIWTAPLLIVVALGAMTWMGTHLLDPYRSIRGLEGQQRLPAGTKPLTVDVVALDWKWLFIFPGQGIATVNDLTLPTNVPVDFHITSATVMNSFFIPALAGQIYAMAGMETKLSVIVDRPGDFNGLSSQYSGSGFSHMNFAVRSMTPQAFDQWVAAVKSKGSALDQKTYDALRKPSEEVPHIYYSSVRPGLFDAILNMCTTPGKMCADQMMAIDANGGGGVDSEANRKRLITDSALSKEGDEAPAATFPASGRPPNSLSVEPQGMKPREVAPDVNKAATPGPGQGQNMPGAPPKSPAPAQLNER